MIPEKHAVQKNSFGRPFPTKVAGFDEHDSQETFCTTKVYKF